MEVPEHRRWMDRRLEDGGVTQEFMEGVLEFVEFASNDPNFLMQLNPKMRCPCKKCQCGQLHYGDDVMEHLCTRGFMLNYYYWTSHGESLPPRPPVVVDDTYYGVGEQREQFNHFEQMIMDHAGPEVGRAIRQDCATVDQHIEEDPNPNAQRFYEMLEAAKAPLWEGCQNYSELSASLVALSIKSDCNMTEYCFNRVVEFMHDTQPPNNRMPCNFYQAKKSVANLGLGVEKIECCQNGCMLYRGGYEAETFVSCRFCGADRYKFRTTRKGKIKKTALKKMWYFPITPRLQRMYSSMATASHMRWHDNNHRDPSVLCHPSDGEAWKHLDRTYPEFSQEARNVRLGLCTNGFNPFGQYGKTYSCWPVIPTPYNLPPRMCMNRLVQTYETYIINGYKFHTRARGDHLKTFNYGVCVRGTHGQLEDDFNGILTDIIEVQYYGRPTKKLVLFKCEWFDNTPDRGTKVDNRFRTVEVRQSRRYQVYDPFIFAQQAEQVYYTPYPEGHRDWLGVIKIKAHSAITDNVVSNSETEARYQEVNEIDGLQVMLHIDPGDYSDILADNGGGDEVVDTALLSQSDLDEEEEDTSILSDSEESESDFSDSDST